MVIKMCSWLSSIVPCIYIYIYICTHRSTVFNGIFFVFQQCQLWYVGTPWESELTHSGNVSVHCYKSNALFTIADVFMLYIYTFYTHWDIHTRIHIDRIILFIYILHSYEDTEKERDGRGMGVKETEKNICMHGVHLSIVNRMPNYRMSESSLLGFSGCHCSISFYLFVCANVIDELYPPMFPYSVIPNGDIYIYTFRWNTWKRIAMTTTSIWWRQLYGNQQTTCVCVCVCFSCLI